MNAVGIIYSVLLLVVHARGLQYKSDKFNLEKRSYQLDEKSSFVSKLHRRKRWDFTTYKIMEELQGKRKITTLHSSFDEGNGDIRYSIKGFGANTLFHVDPKSGDLYALYPLDRETQSIYRLNVSACNLQGVEVENSTVITIEIDDKNDNQPTFERTEYRARVAESSKLGTIVRTITASDEDDPNREYGRIEYSLMPSGDSDSFLIDPSTGQITTAAILDREVKDTYKIQIEARDDPYAKLNFFAVTSLIITVTDVNDQPPVFTERPYKKSVKETIGVGEIVLRLSVTDADLGQNTVTSFRIESGGDSDTFSITTINNRGVISVKKRLDYETAIDHRYRFFVTANNVHVDPALPVAEDTTEVIVEVSDVNEPPEFRKTEYIFSVSEAEPVGSPLHSVSAFDPEGDIFSYWIEDKSGKFFIDRNSGMISLQSKVDRETADQYIFNVAAGIPNSYSKARVIAKIEDINDNPPSPKDENSLTLILCENSDVNTLALQPNITMFDNDSPANGPPFHYFPGKDPNYSLNFKLVDNNDSTASLYTLHNNFYVSEGRNYKVPIVVQDSGKPVMEATYQIAIQVCHCHVNAPPTCEAVSQAGEFNPVIVVAIAMLLLLIFFLMLLLLVFRRRKLKKSEALIADSSSSSANDIRENFISYNEEGGGEEDTAAFDLSILQNDCSSATRSQVQSRSNFTTCPSTKLSSFSSRPRNRSFVPSQDIRNFINGRKVAEDADDRKLAYDSLQVYGYEGEGSEAGSLSSICSSATDSDQSYDYLNDWGPRFHHLADMYGVGKTAYCL